MQSTMITKEVKHDVHGNSRKNKLYLFRDGDEWKSEEIVHLLARHIQVLDVDTVISFDSYGISGHPNHIACEAALRRVGELVGSDVQVSIPCKVTVF